jgi:hypothetical protein
VLYVGGVIGELPFLLFLIIVRGRSLIRFPVHILLAEGLGKLMLTRNGLQVTGLRFIVLGDDWVFRLPERGLLELIDRSFSTWDV